MSDEGLPHARELVVGFLDAVPLSFAFLLRTPGVVVMSNKVVTFEAGSLRTVTPADMPDYFFAASVELSSPTWSVQVSYGEREFALNLLISLQPYQPTETYALWEWLRALDRPPLEPKSLTNVTRPAGVLRAVHSLAAVLEANWAAISDPAPKALARVRANREAWYAKQDMVRREHSRRMAVAAADEAFQRRDFSRVMEVLDPLSESLTRAERAKLEYARRHLSSGRKSGSGPDSR